MKTKALGGRKRARQSTVCSDGVITGIGNGKAVITSGESLPALGRDNLQNVQFGPWQWTGRRDPDGILVVVYLPGSLAVKTGLHLAGGMVGNALG